MKRMRNLLNVLMLVSLLFLFAACGEKEAPAAEPETPAAEGGETAAPAEIDYPTTSIELTIPYAAGDGTDLCARVYSSALEEVLGQPVVCVNREGGGGAVGAAEAAGKAADGYNLYHGTLGVLVAKPLMQDLGYTLDDFTPVAQVTANPLGLACAVDAPYTTVEELVAYAKEHPGELKYASPGSGSLPHIMWESFCLEQGISMVMVPYEGGNSAVSSIVSKECDLAFVGATVLLSQYQAQAVTVLGVTSEERIDIMADAPTFVEQGYDYTPMSWFGVFAPAGTPDEIVAKLSEALETVCNDPAVQEQWTKVNYTPSYLNAADFTEKFNKEAENIKAVVESLGLAK